MAVRKKPNITAGRRLVVKAEENRIILTPLPENPVEDFCGIFEGGDSLTRALLNERKKEREREVRI